MSLRKRTLTGLFWASIQQLSGQFVGIIVSVILARLLSPTDFGLMGMIYIFISVSATLSDAGMSQSLIRMLNPKKEDYSTVFYINILFALLIYIVLFLAAPLIANFYDAEILTHIIRIYSVVFVFTAFSSVQNTILVKNLHFKKQLRLSFPSLLLSGALGIALAASGYGVWSLVWSGVAKAGLYSLQLWFYSDWRPSLVLDLSRFRFHYNFGIKSTLNELLNNLSSSIYPFFLGKFFTPTQTGYFTQASSVRQFPVSTLLGPIGRVAFPALVNLQSEPVRLRATYVKMERITLAALIPAMILGIVLAEPLLIFLLSERWAGATPYLQIACLAGIITIAGTYNKMILQIQNKNGLLLWINTLHKIFMLLALVASIPFGIEAVLWSQVVIALAYYLPSSIITCRTIGYSFWKLVSDHFLLLSIGGIMGAGVWGLKLLTDGTGNLLQLAVCAAGGIILYIALIALFDKAIIKDIRALFAGQYIIRIVNRKNNNGITESEQ